MLLFTHALLALLLAGVVLLGLLSGPANAGRAAISLFGVALSSAATGLGFYFPAVLLSTLVFLILWATGSVDENPRG